MPFGSFYVQKRESRPDAAKAGKESEKPASAAVNCTTLHILLIGRSLSLMQEFLCSMNQNMSQALHQQGLTYYTRELASISDVVSVKKKLEQFFWNFSNCDWTYSNDDTEERVYTFSISPSGNQNRVLDFVIHCAVLEQAEELAWEQADACWILADGLLLDSDAGYDRFGPCAAEALNRSGGKPVCLILSQIEKWGHFSKANDITVFPKEVYRKLIAVCEEKIPVFGDEPQPVPVLPVQIYGGLEYVGADEFSQPRLHISQSGFFRSYIPENCELPGLYTIQAICADREIDFFAGLPKGGLTSTIRSHFADKYGNAGWKPVFAWDKEEV